MIIEKIKTDGLAHLSYLVGSNGRAAVIDPRRDCETYVDKARQRGLEITHIFETHRNEDLVSGAPFLAELTGAKVFHGPNADGDVVYAETTREGDRFEIGELVLEVLETPGHTDDHLAFALHDRNYDDGAVAVFTGDALFIGDVGRTDFYPDRAQEVAGLLYDSLQKILALGDQAIVYPAHGAGSVCGSGMADREFSTVGHERRNNPRLQIEDRDSFIREKTAETHYQPPYFRLMAHLNLVGGGAAPRIIRPKPLTLDELASCGADRVVDIREPTAFASGHLPGSISIPVDMLPAFGGWFLRKDESVALVAGSQADLKAAGEHLVRIGLDNIAGGYVGVVEAAAAGQDFASIPMIGTETVRERLDSAQDGWTLLDVREIGEVGDRKIDAAEHIYVGHLHARWEELDRDRAYTLMCASGKRATIAAGWLASKGFNDLDIYLGSMGAWTASEG